MKPCLFCSLALIVPVVFSSPNDCNAQGPVSAELSPDGVLFVLGDGGYSRVYVTVEAGVIDVTSAYGPVTTSDGGPAEYGENLVREIVVLLGGGSDDLILRLRDNLHANLSIDTGNGVDDVRLRGEFQQTPDGWVLPAIEGDVCINTGNLRDSVYFFRANIVGQTQVTTGGGEDRVIFGEYPRGGDSHFSGDVIINTGVGEDLIEVEDGQMIIDGHLAIEAGQGDDDIFNNGFLSVESLTLIGGQGFDWFYHGALLSDSVNVTGVELEW